MFFLTLGIFSLFSNEINKEKLIKKYRNAKEDSTILNEKIDYEAIQDEINSYKIKFNNDQIIGTLKIPGTNIDTILVKGTDNDFYLNHSIDKKYNVYGSIYLDYRINVSDRKLIFYGHNSKTLITIFHELEKYLEWEFFNQNPYIKLITEAGSEIYKIFSVMIVETGNNRHTKITFNENGFNEHLKWMKETSVYDTLVSVNNKDKIITLQTCYYEPANSYLLVNAKKIKKA